MIAEAFSWLKKKRQNTEGSKCKLFSNINCCTDVTKISLCLNDWENLSKRLGKAYHLKQGRQT